MKPLNSRHSQQGGTSYVPFKAEIVVDLIDTGVAYATISRVYPSFREDHVKVIKENVKIGNVVILRDLRCVNVGLDNKRGNAFFDEGHTGATVEPEKKYLVSAIFCERFIDNETRGVAINCVADLAEWQAIRDNGKTIREKLQQERRDAEKLAKSIFRVTVGKETLMRTLTQLAHTFGILNNEGDVPVIEWPEGAVFKQLVRGRPEACEAPIVPTSIVEEVLKRSQASITIGGQNRFHVADSVFAAAEKKLSGEQAPEQPETTAEPATNGDVKKNIIPLPQQQSRRGRARGNNPKAANA
jgi:hypothetical protein